MMLTQRQTYLEKALLSAATVLLLLTTAGQSAALTDDLQTTETPPLSNTSVTTQLSNSSMEEPLVLRLHTDCGSEHDTYCGNGGKCMYPQDSDKPSCICMPSYGGPRCMYFTEPSQTMAGLEEVIGITCGVIMIIILLVIVIYCCAYERCKKSAPLIKSAPSEISV